MVIGFGAAGLSQAVKLADGAVPFLDAARSPFLYLGAVGFLVLFAGQCAFAVNLAKLLCAVLEPVRKSVCSTFCSRATDGAPNAEVKP